MILTDIFSICLRIGQLIFSTIVTGITGHHLHTVRHESAWTKKRFIYTEIVGPLGMICALLFLLPFTWSFIHWPVDFLLFIMFMVSFGLLADVCNLSPISANPRLSFYPFQIATKTKTDLTNIQFIAPLKCGSLWNWNGITGKSTCSKWKADVAFTFLASIFFLASALLVCFLNSWSLIFLASMIRLFLSHSTFHPQIKILIYRVTGNVGSISSSSNYHRSTHYCSQKMVSIAHLKLKAKALLPFSFLSLSFPPLFTKEMISNEVGNICHKSWTIESTTHTLPFVYRRIFASSTHAALVDIWLPGFPLFSSCLGWLWVWMEYMDGWKWIGWTLIRCDAIMWWAGLGYLHT